jgi:hypothetical protein
MVRKFTNVPMNGMIHENEGIKSPDFICKSAHWHICTFQRCEITKITGLNNPLLTGLFKFFNLAT